MAAVALARPGEVVSREKHRLDRYCQKSTKRIKLDLGYSKAEQKQSESKFKENQELMNLLSQLDADSKRHDTDMYEVMHGIHREHHRDMTDFARCALLLPCLLISGAPGFMVIFQELGYPVMLDGQDTICHVAQSGHSELAKCILENEQVKKKLGNRHVLWRLYLESIRIRRLTSPSKILELTRPLPTTVVTGCGNATQYASVGQEQILFDLVTTKQDVDDLVRLGWRPALPALLSTLFFFSSFSFVSQQAPTAQHSSSSSSSPSLSPSHHPSSFSYSFSHSFQQREATNRAERLLDLLFDAVHKSQQTNTRGISPWLLSKLPSIQLGSKASQQLTLLLLNAEPQKCESYPCYPDWDCRMQRALHTPVTKTATQEAKKERTVAIANWIVMMYMARVTVPSQLIPLGQSVLNWNEDRRINQAKLKPLLAHVATIEAAYTLANRVQQQKKPMISHFLQLLHRDNSGLVLCLYSLLDEFAPSI